jgi:hypothetical protein
MIPDRTYLILVLDIDLDHTKTTECREPAKERTRASDEEQAGE